MPSAKDSVTKSYMSNPVIFADAFNFFLYDGKQVIRPEALRELDTATVVLPYGTDGVEVPVQRYRDLLKSCTIMEDERAAYLLLGIENQSDIHYAMPVRNMLYDSLQYASQVQRIAEYHRKIQDGAGVRSGEFLSGFYRSDRLHPVITLVICFSGEAWDAPTRLHEMLEVESKDLLRFIPDYRINLITPATLTQEDAAKFRTELRKILLCLKYSKDRKEMRTLLCEEFKTMSRDAANLLNVLAGLRLRIPSDEEEIEMWKAFEDIIQEAVNEVRAESDHRLKEAVDEVRAESDHRLREAVDEVRAESDHRLKEAVNEARVNSIRSLMESLHLTAQEAMDALKIPVAERSAYLPQL